MSETLEVGGMTVERGAVSLGEFTFECGESIPDLTVAYETYGEFDADGAEQRSAGDRTESGNNVVLVCHALTGSAHVAGRRDDADAQVVGDNAYGPDRTGGQARAWWDDIVGPGKAIDTNEYYVVCVNLPGSCYGTTGPASENPETGEPYATDFPPVTVGDWTRAQRAALDALGVGRLHAVVGGSVGGMNVLEWGKQYPDDVDRLVPIAAAARLDAQCLGLDAIAGRAITSDPNWQGGRYYGVSDNGGSSESSDGDERPDRGLAMARQVGHLMYLSKASMGRKFGRRSAGRDSPGPFPAGPTARYFPYREVESYLDYNAEKFVRRFDANSYLYLMAAMDNYDLSAGYNTDADALAAFDGETLVMSFTADWHFTVEQADALAAAAEAGGGGVAHHVVDSDHGHDAFLVEPEKVGPPLRDFLADGVEGRAVSDARDDGADRAPVHSSLFSR